jgi:hypothetical protein
MSQRGGSDGIEHEGSRRMKTELLIQMDGLATGRFVHSCHAEQNSFHTFSITSKLRSLL